MPFPAAALRTTGIPSCGTAHADEYAMVTAHGAGEFGHLSGKLRMVAEPGSDQTAECSPGKRGFCRRIVHCAHLIDRNTLLRISINMPAMKYGYMSGRL